MRSDNEEFPDTILLNSGDETATEDSSSPTVQFAEELEIIRKLTLPSIFSIQSYKVSLGEKTQKYTLLLDLDETLISARAENGMITIRPHAMQLLKELSSLYELVIFTAAEEDHVLTALKYLDPEGQYINKVLSRKHCVLTEDKKYFIKDLRVISDRKLEEMLIVDNSIISFAFHLENGIPVSSFYGNTASDDELQYLIKYLTELYEEPDLISANKAQIGLC